MLGIALRYGVGLAELTSANPTVNPNIMSIGTILVIPVSLTPTAAAQVSAEDVVALTPTAIPVLMHPVTCTRARDGGIWCFQALENNQDITLESLTGVFHLRADDGQTRTQKAALPLDTLPPGASLPLAAYFSPEDSAGVSEPFQVTSELYTALPNPDDGRYVPSQPQNQKVFISADGLSAEVTLEVELAQDGQQANRVWVAAVAYDENDQVVGVRRWEKQSEQPLVSGETLPVQMQIYSAAGPIQRITVLTEARP